MNLADVTPEDVERALILTFGAYGSDGDYDDDYDAADYEGFHGWGALEWDIKEHGEYSYDNIVWDQKTRKNVNLGKVVIPHRPARDTLLGFKLAVVEDFGGEGMGDNRYIVISLSDGENTKYFRKDGFYASYDGTTWDGDFYEVTPVQRVVTFYE